MFWSHVLRLCEVIGMRAKFKQRKEAFCQLYSSNYWAVKCVKQHHAMMVFIMVQGKKSVFSFIPVTKHYNLFQCLHRTIFSDSGCRLIQNSEKLESHLPKPSNTIKVVQLHPPRCREQETRNTSQASIMSPLTIILPETASLTTDWRCINLTHTDANETNSAACLIHWEKKSLYIGKPEQQL